MNQQDNESNAIEAELLMSRRGPVSGPATVSKDNKPLSRCLRLSTSQEQNSTERRVLDEKKNDDSDFNDENVTSADVGVAAALLTRCAR
ncbi:hypothetical protein ACLKA6_009233 [Drosophila palustris]